MTSSSVALVRNWYLKVVSRFWNPLALGPPGGLRWVQVDPMETPKFSVMRFENSAEMSISRADGSSPFLKNEMVGSDSSSATQGSSTLRVAGKNRPPTKQCAKALDEGSNVVRAAETATRRKRRAMGIFPYHLDANIFGRPIGRQTSRHVVDGRPAGLLAEVIDSLGKVTVARQP